jgi:hypothetical protein
LTQILFIQLQLVLAVLLVLLLVVRLEKVMILFFHLLPQLVADMVFNRVALRMVVLGVREAVLLVEEQ